MGAVAAVPEMPKPDRTPSNAKCRGSGVSDYTV